MNMKWIKWLAIGLGLFLLLCLLLPGPRTAAPQQLCGAGQEMMRTTGASEEQARRIACDSDAATRDYQALVERQHGS